MSATERPARKTVYTRQAGEGRTMSPEEMDAWVARFDELTPDPNAFRDANDPNRRLKIMWAISPGNMGGPAGIATPHSFHMCYIESWPGHHPVLHYHDYAEVFVCLRGQYTIHWGDDGEFKVVLGPYDTFSVPPGVMRSVENTGKETGLVMVLFGDVEDPNAGIRVPQAVIDADRAAGRDI